MRAWTNKGQNIENNGSLVAPSKGHVGVQTFEDFPVLDTTASARILRGADPEAINWRLTCRVIHINLVAFIKWFLDVRFVILEEDES